MQDLEARRTLAGPHRDDFIFQLNGRSLKKTGSQGQQKSFLLSLKLAQYQFLKQKKDRLPWLLMDDIFDKLDDLRISRLIKLVSGPGTGQVFLTDARFERTHQILKVAGVDFQEIRL
jgi:DNA replication and repair protein RecF